MILKVKRKYFWYIVYKCCATFLESPENRMEMFFESRQSRVIAPPDRKRLLGQR